MQLVSRIPVLQQVEQCHDSSISTNDCFKPVSRYWDRISRPEQLMTAMINAMAGTNRPCRYRCSYYLSIHRMYRERRMISLNISLKNVFIRIDRRLATQAMFRRCGQADPNQEETDADLWWGGTLFRGTHDAFRQFCGKNTISRLVKPRPGRARLCMITR